MKPERIAIVVFGNGFNNLKRLKESFVTVCNLLDIDTDDVIILANEMKDNSLVEQLCEDFGLKYKLQPTKWKDFDEKPCVIRKKDGHRFNYFAIPNRNSKMMRFISKADKKAVIVVYKEENTNVSQLLRTAKRYKIKIAKIRYK